MNTTTTTSQSQFANIAVIMRANATIAVIVTMVFVVWVGAMWWGLKIVNNWVNTPLWLSANVVTNLASPAGANNVCSLDGRNSEFVR